MVRSYLLYNETKVISNFSELCPRQRPGKDWFSEEFRICPSCCGIIRFVYDKSESIIPRADVNFLFDEFNWINEPSFSPESWNRRNASILMLHPNLPKKIEITSPNDFTDHVIKCHQDFSEFLHLDGLKGINDDDDAYCKRIPNLMYFLSKKENNYLWNDGGLWDKESLIPVNTIVLFESNIPIAYCAFSEYYAFSTNDESNRNFPEWIVSVSPKNERGEIMFGIMLDKSISDRYIGHGKKLVIHDLYTFPDYRNQGKSSKILNHLRDELKLDTDNLLVTEPLTKQSKSLISKFSTRNVVCLAGENSKSAKNESALGGKSYSKNELI